MHTDSVNSLYEVDHASLGVGHLPVLGQRHLALVPRQHAPGPEVHGTAGMCVARYSLPPIGAFLMLCNQRYDMKRGGGKDWMDEKQVHRASLS